MNFNFTVDPEGFYVWTDKALNGVMNMAKTLYNIQNIVWMNTVKKVPLQYGYLMFSFWDETEIHSQYPMFELDLTMSGLKNPKARGFDYALIQHEENFHHPIQGQSQYLREGFYESEKSMMVELENDYLTALGV